jgi:hypothetical protein
MRSTQFRNLDAEKPRERSADEEQALLDRWKERVLGEGGKTAEQLKECLARNIPLKNLYAVGKQSLQAVLNGDCRGVEKPQKSVRWTPEQLAPYQRKQGARSFRSSGASRTGHSSRSSWSVGHTPRATESYWNILLNRTLEIVATGPVNTGGEAFVLGLYDSQYGSMANRDRCAHFIRDYERGSNVTSARSAQNMARSYEILSDSPDDDDGVDNDGWGL